MNTPKVLYGAGCQGRVCMEIAECNGWKFTWVVDDHAKIHQIYGVPIIQKMSIPGEISGEFEFVVAAGDNKVREQFAIHLSDFGGKPINLVHPFSQYSQKVLLGRGVVSMAGVIVNTNVSIGDYCVLNTSSSIDHDCVLGDYVNICPGAHLAGGVHVGKSSFLGTGCIVNPNVKIGKNCIIGSGAVVTTDIPDFSIAYGVPARIKRTSA